VEVGIRGSWVALRHLGPKLDLGHSPQPFAFTFLHLTSCYTQATHNSASQYLFVAPKVSGLDTVPFCYQSLVFF
jgi:hypothetical protein